MTRTVRLLVLNLTNYIKKKKTETLLKPPNSQEKSQTDMTSVFPVVAVVFGSDVSDTLVS